MQQSRLARVKGGRLATAPVPAGLAPVPPLVSTGWLARQQADPDLAVVQVGRRDDPPPAGSLPGAARLDWIEDLQHPGRRGVADGGEFAAVAGRLGIGRETHVVLAGERRPQLAASAYWSFAYHGHMRLSILDGGLPRWTAEGREVTAAATGRTPTEGYRPGLGRRDLLVTRDQLLGGLVGAPPGTALVDCRTPAEFAGRTGRPYDVPADRHRLTGHVPGARNLPAEDLLDAGGLLLDTVQIGQLCDAVGLRPVDQITVYCGVNDRSALVWFALHELLGWPDVRCYFGAWSEYGSLTDVPIAQRTGAPSTDETNAEPA
jgi:thiosulfate/3-mercaptopyruvate sulfurtransferase